MPRLFLTLLCLCLCVSWSAAQPSESPPLPRDRTRLALEFGLIESVPKRVPAPLYRVGDRKPFTVLGDNEAVRVEAELIAQGQHLSLWVDVESLRGVNFEAIVAGFDSGIYTQARALWGSESMPGIDGDPRVYVLVTHRLAEGVAGYFSSDNTYPPEVVSTSSAHEMFFLSAWGLTPQSAAHTLAHEFQHMIRDHIAPGTDTWLDEGFSMFTALHLGYDSGVRESNAFTVQPHTPVNTWGSAESSIAAHYGASLLFVTYFYERFGEQALRGLSVESARGLDAFTEALRDSHGMNADAFFADWVIANWMNDSAFEGGRYAYRLLDVHTPRTRARIAGYPYTHDDTLAPYGTHYFALDTLPQGDTLRIMLDAPMFAPQIPTDAPQGDGFAVTARADNAVMSLTRPLDLRGTQTAALHYALWHQLEENWDYGYVLVSEDGGTRWTPLRARRMTDANPFGTAYSAGYTGASGGWLEESVTLDAFAGREVLVRFMMINDDAMHEYGMALDDIRLVTDQGSVTLAGFEDGLEGWAAHGWHQSDNRTPQRFYVQVIQYQGDQPLRVDRVLWETPDTPLDIALLPDADSAVLALSPLADTLVSADYRLTVAAP